MNADRKATINGVLSLVAGIAFCALAFSYGVTQEAPMGQLEGTVLLAETGKPLPHAEVNLSVHDDDSARDRFVTADDRGHFRFRNVKVGDYDLTVSASEHTQPSHTISVSEGKPTQIEIRLKPNAPYLKMYASQRVWMPQEAPQLELHGFRVGDVLDVEVDRIALKNMLSSGNFVKAIHGLRIDQGQKTPPEFEKYATREVSFKHRVKTRDSEGAFIDPLVLPVLPEGFYWVKCKGTRSHVATYVNVSRLALVTKTSKGHVLGYVTDLVSGKPIEGATIFTQNSLSRVESIKTNVDGLAAASYGSSTTETDGRAAILATLGNSVATVGVYTNAEADNSGGATFVLYTDRPIYRPGDEVQFKGIVRRKVGEKFLPPIQGPIEIAINDTDDQPMMKFHLQASNHGTFSGRFTTSKEAGPGLYRILANGFGGKGSHFVHMVAYRKPEFSIQIKPLRPNYMIGDKVKVAIQCSYYFGGPVVGAKLSGNVFASSVWNRDPDDDTGEGQSNSYAGGDLTKQIQAVTDSKGQAIFEFETRQANETSIPLNDLDFNVNVNTSDQSNKYVDATRAIRVTRGAFDLLVQSQNYLVTPGQTVDLLVAAKSNSIDHLPVAKETVSVTVNKETWKGEKTVLQRIGTYPAVTGKDGIVHVPIQAATDGTMLFIAECRDEFGHIIRSEDRVYVVGGPWHAEADQSKLEVTVDKRKYKVGDVARIMIRTMHSGGSALVTLQNDHILWTKVVSLTENATIVSLPVDASYSPNCFVSVAYVKKKIFYEGDSRLTVDPTFRKLQVSVQSDKATFEPGGVAHLTVVTRDPKGIPVPAEVSLGVVDESIYAIREDDFNILEEFYPKRNNEVTTTYSFAEVYLDGGDKGAANVEIRHKFLDTAKWIPSIQTDKNGRASVAVNLPDNLTEWRATAVGVTDATVVGKSSTKFKARKPLMVRLEMPEFLVQQDERQMQVMITNDTGADQDVHVSLAAQGITVEGSLQQTVRVSTDNLSTLTFQLKTGVPGNANLTAKAWIVGGTSDGVRQGFRVLAHGIPVRNAWSDEVSDAKDFDVPLAQDTDRTDGRLKVEISSSLAGSLVGALDGLVGFPYGCVEQTMSRFMPSILVAKAVRDLGIPRPALEKEIPKIAADSMIRLGRMQHSDGGWGWWENDASDPFMTALVLDGLDRCKKAGYPVLKVDVSKALTWCMKRVGTKDWKADSQRDRSYVVYALARYGKIHEAKAAYASIILRAAPPSVIASLALAANDMGSDFKAERDKLLDRLARSVQQGPLGAFWNDSEWEWGSESTALGLTAFVEGRPSDPIVPRIVRYLMRHRRGEMWDSTRDTSYALVGLTEYIVKTRELTGAFDARIFVNGRLVQTAHLDARNPDQQSRSVEIPVANMQPGSNTVRIEKSGPGTCYVGLDLQATEIKQKISPSVPVPGLKITRKYYLMEARKLEDGTMQLLPSRRPVTSAESGDILRVELTIESSKARGFIMVEDPTPSNCRVTEREELDEGEEWSNWWDQLVIRDQKISFFIRNLPEGKQTLTYNMRAEGLGVAHTLPTTLSSMYDLTVNASGAETLMEVK